MCLITSQTEPCIATQNIPVYKLVRIKRGFMYAPFQDCLLRERPRTILPTEFDEEEHLTTVYEGFIHADLSPEHNLNLYIEEILFSDLKIIPGYIPRGTKYYQANLNINEDWYNRDHVAAEHIIFKVPWYQRIAMNIRNFIEKH